MSWRPKSTSVEVIEATGPAARRRSHHQIDRSSRPGRQSRSWLPVRRHRGGATAGDAVGAPMVSTGPAYAEIAAEAVASFRAQAIGARCGSGRDASARVRVVCSSAAHFTHPAQLEVWVLLGDVDEDRIPPRWDPTEVIADAELTAWALQLRGAALGHLISLDWPHIDSVVVRIDAAERVERRGGWDYVMAIAA